MVGVNDGGKYRGLRRKVFILASFCNYGTSIYLEETKYTVRNSWEISTTYTIEFILDPSPLDSCFFKAIGSSILKEC